MPKKQTCEKLAQRVTERKQTEEALQKSEIKYRTLLENLPQKIFIKNQNLVYLICNKNYADDLSITPEEIVGKTDYDFYPKELADKYRSDDKAILAAGQVYEFEEQYLKDGEEFIVKTIKIPFRDNKGNIKGVQGVFWDITKQKQAEDELKKKTHDLQERVKELDCLFGVSQLVETEGISVEEIYQRTVDLLPEAWQYPDIATARIILDAQEFKTKKFKKTQWCQLSDIIVHGQLSGQVAVCYLEQKPVCHEGPFLKEERSLIDTIAQRLGRIAERRRGEIEIRCLKEKFEDLFHNAPIMYLSLNINGIITECNNTLLDKMGYARDEVIGEHMAKLLTQQSAAIFKKEFPVWTESDKISGLERQMVTKSGKVIDALVSISREYDEHGNMITTRASFEDISSLKRAKNRVHSLTQALISAQENERLMISRELHDQIAQDLVTLKVGFDTLLYNLPKLDEKERQKANGFSEIFRNTIAAVRDLSYTLRPPALDEMGIVKAIFIFCENFTETRGVTVHFNATGMDNIKLSSESKINLYRLVQEGLNNVHKHAKAADAFVKLVAVSPNIILRIQDNGQGFDVADRLEDAPKEKRMGIQSMEERTKLLGGKMTVKSIPSKGTIVSIKIPQKQDRNGSP